jgi:hypothetical protein
MSFRRQGRQSRSTAFPIYTDERAFRNDGVTRIETISGDEHRLIERVQPFAASEVPNPDPLAILNRLSNADKHRLLVPVIAAVNVRESWVASDNADVRFQYIARGQVNDGTKIVSFIAEPQRPNRRDDHPPEF